MASSGKVLHGHANRGNKSPTWWSWIGMRARCENPENKEYHRYGGRGITVCPEWQDFATFLADMGERPPGTTLDREKLDLGYSAINCRWATPLEQGENRSTNTYLTYDGKTQHLSAWAKETGIPASTLSRRLLAGYTPFEALHGRDKVELSTAISVARTTHGHAPRGKGTTPTYSSWLNMKTRVTNPKSDSYVEGVTMIERWVDFENFLEDMGERPNNAILRRVDSGKGYDKDNCTWADPSQYHVSKSTRFLVVDGVSKPLQVWAKEVGIPWDRIRSRLKLGWSPEEAIERVPRKK